MPAILWRSALDNSPEASDRIVTIPNVISFVRILAVPYFVWLVIGPQRFALAAGLLIAIGATDWLDGYLARRLGQTSKLGKALDPVADRLAIVAAVIVGWTQDILPSWFVGGLLTREAIMATLTAWLMWKYRTTIAVRLLGKGATLLLYGAIPALYLVAADVGGQPLRIVGIGAAVAGLILYWGVALFYVGDMRQAARNSVSSDTPEQGAE